MDAESWGENANVAQQLSAHAVPKQWLRSFSLSLLSLLVKRREDVITGKPEASNTFLIKWQTIYDGF